MYFCWSNVAILLIFWGGVAGRSMFKVSLNFQPSCTAPGVAMYLEYPAEKPGRRNAARITIRNGARPGLGTGPLNLGFKPKTTTLDI